MFKKMAIPASCLLFLTAPACADHFYLGGAIGVSSLFSAQSTDIPSRSHNLGGFGFVGGGFLGYNFYFPCSRADLGVEFFINGNTARNKIVHGDDDGRLTVASRYNWGLRVLPGYWFGDNVEGHFILGYTQAGIRLQDDGAYNFISKTFTASGWQLGLGTNIALSCHWDLRLDWIYSSYSTSRHYGLTEDFISDRNSIRPSTLDGLVSLIYKF